MRLRGGEQASFALLDAGPGHHEVVMIVFAIKERWLEDRAVGVGGAAAVR